MCSHVVFFKQKVPFPGAMQLNTTTTTIIHGSHFFDAFHKIKYEHFLLARFDVFC